MTDETSRPTSEDTPAPPASTRWTEEPLQEDDALASPFVPGRSAAGTPSRPAPASSGEPGRQEASPWEQGRDTPPAEDATVEDVVSGPGDAETTAETAPDTFPFEQFDLEGEDEEEAPDEATEPVAAVEADAAPSGWTPADLNYEDVAVEEPAVEEPAVEEPTVEASAGAEPAREAAEILERLAGLLRSDGLEAVRGEMQSPDRLTSLLAGLVAGYVTGRS